MSNLTFAASGWFPSGGCGCNDPERLSAHSLGVRAGLAPREIAPIADYRARGSDWPVIGCAADLGSQSES